MSNSIVVKYSTKKKYCSCCSQELPNEVVSDEREFEISSEAAASWTDWDLIAEFPEDMDVGEFVHEVIYFHSVNSNEKLMVNDSEVERVRSWILDTVVTKSIDQTDQRSLN